MRNGKLIRIPAETEKAIIKRMPNLPLSFASLLLIHQALQIEPPTSPEARKAAGGRAVTGQAKNPHKAK